MVWTRCWMSVPEGVETHSVVALGPARTATTRIARPPWRAAPQLTLTQRHGAYASYGGACSMTESRPNRHMTIRWKVALVEDDRRLARAVSAGLGEEGYTVRTVD